MPRGANTVVFIQPTAVVMQPERKVPVVVFVIEKESAPACCHICGTIVDTRVHVSYLICRFLTAILCLYGYVIMLIPLAAVSPCIPILTVENWNGFRLYRHYCPDCDTFLGKYHPKVTYVDTLCLIMVAILPLAMLIFVLIIYILTL